MGAVGEDTGNFRESLQPDKVELGPQQPSTQWQEDLGAGAPNMESEQEGRDKWRMRIGEHFGL